MEDMTNSSTEKAKATVAAKASKTDFSSMNAETFGSWIDALPIEEFFGLLHLHDEFQATGEITVPDVPVNAPKAPEPDDSSWVVYTGEGVPPLPEDAICWVLFPDGGTAGPNRVDAFLWGGDGQATILAYAPAVLVH